MSTFGYLFRSLWKNDVCIDGARKFKWYVALIYFFLSIIIALIPVTTSSFLTNGGSFLSSHAYEIDSALASFTYNVLDQQGGLTFDLTTEANGKNQSVSDVNEQNILTITGYDVDDDGNRTEHSNLNYYTPIYQYDATFTVVDSNTSTSGTSYTEETKTVLQVYDLTYFPVEEEKITSDEGTEIVTMPSFSDVVSLITTGVTLPVNIEDIYSTLQQEKESSTSTRTTSFMAFGKSLFVIYKYDSKGSLYASTYGYYTDLAISSLNDIRSLSTLRSSEEQTYTEYDIIVNSWQNLLTTSYLRIKDSTAWLRTAIVLAVDSGIILIMALIIFVVTRGKNNPYRIYTLWECFKICSWLALTPAIISLIAFMLPLNIGLFIFMLVYGVRVMFMWSKNLRNYN